MASSATCSTSCLNWSSNWIEYQKANGSVKRLSRIDLEALNATEDCVRRCNQELEMGYVAPLKDMLFVLNELAGLPEVSALPHCEDARPEIVAAILEENARFCSEVVAPLNHAADQEPSFWSDGKVTTSKGFKEAFRKFCAAGWQGVRHPVAFGGQGLPRLVATPCIEMLNAASLSFALCPLLTDGAIEALMIAGSDAQKNTYLVNLISGRWTGTMNLTEPQAGSDLALICTRAVLQNDGSYRLSGSKIFITYGEHDMAENIVHLVLARTPDAPEGVKGVSLFVVPKFLVEPDGSLGERNDVHCVSIEHKLGIKAKSDCGVAVWRSWRRHWHAGW